MKKLMTLGLMAISCAMLAAACGGGKPADNGGNKAGGGGGDDVLRNPVPQNFKDMSPPDLSDTDLIAQGEALYNDPAKGNCVMCHGKSGKADGPQAANYSDPAVSDLSAATFQDAVSDQYIFWRIKEPVKSKANPNSGMLGYSAGSDDQIWSMVAYVRSLKGS